MIKTLKERIRNVMNIKPLTFEEYKEAMGAERLSRIPLYYTFLHGISFWAVGFDNELIDIMREKGLTGTFNYGKDFYCWTEEPTREEISNAIDKGDIKP